MTLQHGWTRHGWMPQAGVVLTAILLATACTDWDTPVRGPAVENADPRATADVDPTGLVYWDTSGTLGDAAAHDGATADDSDAFSSADDVPFAPDADAGDSAVDFGPTIDVVVVDVAVPDVSVGQDVADAAACSAIGCPCSASSQCASGLCVNGASGLVCSPSCKNVDCPAGWECSGPAYVCKKTTVEDVQADAAATDVDTAAVDAAEVAQDDADASQADLPDSQADAVPDADAGTDADSGTDATAGTDSVSDAEVGSDVASGTDVETGTDIQAGTDAETGTDAVSDVADISDVSDVSDVSAIDTADADGFAGPDWSGYPDANFPDGADIYGGAINSCLSLYLFQQETCGKNNPTATCINDVATQGSLYANYLFEPLRACQADICTDLCVSATDETCMNQCIGKYCPNPFLACVANNEHGTANCQTTFTCAMGYEGKMLTIGSKCYANGTLDAQLQVGDLLSCVTKPQTDSCFAAIAQCYDQGSAATATCSQTITCTQNCGSDQICSWICLGKASSSARIAVDALGDCMVTQCQPKCGNDQNCTNNCLSSTCSSQFGNCIAN